MEDTRYKASEASLPCRIERQAIIRELHDLQQIVDRHPETMDITYHRIHYLLDQLDCE